MAEEDAIDAAGAPGPLVIVMGPAGSGKSTIGRAIATSLGATFVDGDDYHTEESIDKMRAGTPLTDADREPWLESLSSVIESANASGTAIVLACSALRRRYRDILRSRVPTDRLFVVELRASERTLRRRMQQRPHFMPSSLLRSQLETLESLAPDEPGIRVDAGTSRMVVTRRALEAINGRVRMKS